MVGGVDEGPAGHDGGEGGADVYLLPLQVKDKGVEQRCDDAGDAQDGRSPGAGSHFVFLSSESVLVELVEAVLAVEAQELFGVVRVGGPVSGESAEEGFGIAGAGTSLGVGSDLRQDAVAIGEAGLHGVVAGEAGDGTDQLAVCRLVRRQLDPGQVPVRLNAEVVRSEERRVGKECRL